VIFIHSALVILELLSAQAQPPAKAPLERAVEEFKVVTGELGLRSDSPTTKAVRKPVLSAWHGRLFENFRNDKLDATPHEVVQRGGSRNILRRNQFGFNVGGPVVIPKLYDGSRKTFLNVSYEGVRERIGRSNLSTVAIDAERAGDFSQTVDPAGNPLPIYDPLTTRLNPNFDETRPVTPTNLQYARDPFVGNLIPVTRLDPVATKTIPFYPRANSNAGPFFRNNYFVFSPETNQANGMIFKVDHTINDQHRMTFNGSFTNGLAGAPRLFDTIADSGSNDRQFSARRGILEWTYTRNATTVNSFTFDAQSDKTNSGRPGQAGALATIGLGGPLSAAFPNFKLGGYLPTGRINPTTVSGHNYFYLTEALSTRIGKHRLRGSAQFRRYQVNGYLPRYPAGSFDFGPSLTSLPGINNTGHAFASFLLGLAEAGTATIAEHPSYWRGNYFRFSAADAYEINKNLILNLSFALEMTGARREKFDRFGSVDLDAINPANGLPGALIFADRNGVGRALQRSIWRPETSFGLAWNPRGNSKSVVRLSYGLSHSGIPIYTTQWASQGFIAQPVYISQNIQLTPAIRLRDGAPPLERPLPDLRPDGANFTIADLVQRQGDVPRYQSAGLSYERTLAGQTIVSLSLGHARGQRLFFPNSVVNPNSIPLSYLSERDQLNSEAFRRTIRPYPQYQRFNLFSSWPSANYKRNAAAVRIEKRSASGLVLNSTYEFSKQMDDYSGPTGIQDYYNMKNEWSLTNGNNPHRLSLSFSYDLPLGSKKSLLTFQDWRRYFVDGWTFSGITSMQSGIPLGLRPQFNNTGGLVEGLRVNLVDGVNPRVEDPGPNRWFNPAAFAQPADFTIGNGPRTHPQLVGPGSQNHDLSVSKRFELTAERVIELTATGFNWTNVGNWADPDTVIGPASAPNVNAGRSIESRGGRVVQLGLRLSF
jgi:hypothetical protein